MRNTISLNGAWRLSGLDERVIEAQVPGQVHVDLYRAGVIPDPYHGLNADHLEWVGEKKWSFSREIELGEDFFRRKTFLEFDGLDTLAAVFLNGREIGRAANMFVPHRFDVTGLIRPGTNTLLVEFEPVDKGLEPANQAPQPGCDETPHAGLRRMQCGFGPGQARGFVSAGIWRDVRLVSYDCLSISDVYVEPEIVGGCAEAWIAVEIENHTDKEARAAVSIVVAYGESRERIELVEMIPPTGGVVEAVVRIEEPQLWWPNGFGEQPLYTCMVGVQHESEVQDVAETRFGVRNIGLVERDRDGSNRFTLLINGHEVFCKGANWIPADCFVSNVTPERYKDLVRLAREANFNMLRVWGGGIYEHPAFYDACDEMGIMVWQDFMFDRATYPDTPEFAEGVAREAESVVKRLRNHPSIVIWCGNSECETNPAPGQHWPCKGLFYETLPNVLKRLDHTRPYRPSLPYCGVSGNDPTEDTRHGGSWLSACLGDHTQWRHMIEQDRAPFVVEFYAQGSPDVGSLRQFIPQQDLFPPTGAVWEFHNASKAHLSFASEKTHHQLLVDLTRRMMGDFDSPEEFAALSGILQGEFVRAHIEHFRREKWAISGALYWTFDDCWPAIGCSLVDYYLRPKPAYYYAKRACAPVIVSFNKLADRVQVHVTSDQRLRDTEGLLRVGVLTFESCGLELEEVPVKLPANSSASFWESGPLDQVLSDPASQCLVALLYSRDTIIAKSFWFALPFGKMRFPRPKLLVERQQLEENRHRMVIAADGFARNVFISNIPASARPSDNYFDLLPGEAYEVTIDGLTVEQANDLRIGTWGR